MLNYQRVQQFVWMLDKAYTVAAKAAKAFNLETIIETSAAWPKVMAHSLPTILPIQSLK